MARASKASFPERAIAELLLRERTNGQSDIKTPYRIFQEKYRDDPAGFVSDCIEWGKDKPADYQLEIANQLPIRRKVSVRAPHGVGKTALMALLILWFALVNDGWEDWKIPITASNWRQLSKYLMPEVHKWARKIKWGIVGRYPFNERTELEKENLIMETGLAFAMASDNPAMIEGAHADRILYVFDESKEIPDETWDSAEGAFSTGDCYWLSVSTPGEPQGRFYDIQSRKQGTEDWYARHVTLDEFSRAGRVNLTWVAQMKKLWGEESAVYKNRVLGEFATSEKDGVIPLSWIEKANEWWHVYNDMAEEERPIFKCVGVDVAWSGEDATVLALRFGYWIKELRESHLEDTMMTTGRTMAVLHKHGGFAVVDVIGIGAGVVNRLRELKQDVRPFNAAEHTDRTDYSGEWGFVNKRSASWWNVRELLDPSNGYNVGLPPDDKLTGDLVSAHWKPMSGGKIQVESKEDIRKRISRSTDFADAVIMALFDDESPSADEWIKRMKATKS